MAFLWCNAPTGDRWFESFPLFQQILKNRAQYQLLMISRYTCFLPHFLPRKRGFSRINGGVLATDSPIGFGERRYLPVTFSSADNRY